MEKQNNRKVMSDTPCRDRAAKPEATQIDQAAVEEVLTRINFRHPRAAFVDLVVSETVDRHELTRNDCENGG